MARVIAGCCTGVRVTVAAPEVVLPSGAVPVAVAVFTRVPVSTSACETVYGALTVQVVWAVGASVVAPQVTVAPDGIFGSVTVMLVSVAEPVFCTTKE